MNKSRLVQRHKGNKINWEHVQNSKQKSNQLRTFQNTNVIHNSIKTMSKSPNTKEITQELFKNPNRIKHQLRTCQTIKIEKTSFEKSKMKIINYEQFKT